MPNRLVGLKRLDISNNKISNFDQIKFTDANPKVGASGNKAKNKNYTEINKCKLESINLDMN